VTPQGQESRTRAARLAGASILVLAVTVTGWLLWRGFQPVLTSDVRRDLFLDQAHVRLLSGFDDRDLEALFGMHAETSGQQERDAIAVPAGRNSALEWDVDCRPGRFRMDVARLVVGSAADDTPCTLTVSAFGAGQPVGALLGQASLALPACPALEGAAATGPWREGPSAPLALELPQGAHTLRIEVQAATEGADRAPDGSAIAMLSPRVEQEATRTPLSETVRAISLEERLLPHVLAVTKQTPLVVFATRRSQAAQTPEDVKLPAVQAVAAFTGSDGRPAVSLVGAASVAWTVDVQADSVLRGAVALDDRLPPGTRVTLEVRVDDAVVASQVVDSAHWRELSVPLGAHAGPGRRLTCVLVAPELQVAEVLHKDLDFVFGREIQRGYTARRPCVGFADPRLVREAIVPVRRATSGRPAVILIQVETLRPDALGAWLAGAGGGSAGVGGARVSHTPNLDAFAAKSTVWEWAFTPAPWTLPTSVSALTGLLPSAHGAVDHDRLVVPGDVPTLAELAGRAGVATGAVVASELLRGEAGFARGFDSFAHIQYANARQVNDLAGAFLANHAGQQFLLFLHYFDPHSPYSAPGEWADRFVDADLRGQRMSDVEQRVLAELDSATHAGRVPAPDERDVRFLRQRYAGEVAWFDSQFRALQDKLASLGLQDSTVIALTADHGEEFFEHGLWGHGSHLFDESLHVPLIVSGPRGIPGLSLAGTRITTPVCTTGLFASVLRWLQVPFDAASVRPALDAEPPERAIYSETSKGIALVEGSDPLRRHLHRVRTSDHMLTWTEPVEGEKGSDTRQLFDLRADPDAQRALSPDQAPGPQLWGELQQAMNWCDRHKAASPLPGGDAAQLETLRALGYVSGQRGGAPGDGPK